ICSSNGRSGYKACLERQLRMRVEEIEPTLEFRGDFDAARLRLPLKVKLGGKGRSATRLVVPNEQTLAGVGGRSLQCQKATSVLLIAIMTCFTRPLGDASDPFNWLPNRSNLVMPSARIILVTDRALLRA